MKILNEKMIQIIVPCLNEEENIEKIVIELDRYLINMHHSYNIMFVDDGSTDSTCNEILKVGMKRKDVNLIKLSRNFGKEAAIAAGLNLCSADAAIIIDSDLQHPPHLIPAMILEWEKGANIVDAVKIKRQKENIIIKWFSLIFYKIMNSLTSMDFMGASDYKLLDKTAIKTLNGIEEKNRFFRGLTNWVGLRHCKIEFNVQERNAGTSKWNCLKLFQLSIDAMTSYSSKPLQIVTFIGMLTLLFSLFLGIQTLYNKFYGNAVSGFTTVILVIVMLSSAIMICMGIIGIYLGKIYSEVKNRPLFIIEADVVCNDANETDLGIIKYDDVTSNKGS